MLMFECGESFPSVHCKTSSKIGDVGREKSGNKKNPGKEKNKGKSAARDVSFNGEKYMKSYYKNIIKK